MTAAHRDAAAATGEPAAAAAAERAGRQSPYPYWFYLPAGVIYIVLLPRADGRRRSTSASPAGRCSTSSSSGWTTSCSSSRSRRWSPASRNTLIYAVVTSGLKVVLGMLLAVLLTAPIIARGLPALGRLLPGAGQHDRRRPHLPGADAPRPTGSINQALGVVGIDGPGLADRPEPGAALGRRWSTSGRASGLATVIYIAGIVSIPQRVLRGRRGRRRRRAGSSFRHITLPLRQAGHRRRSSSCR